MPKMWLCATVLSLAELLSRSLIVVGVFDFLFDEPSLCGMDIRSNIRAIHADCASTIFINLGPAIFFIADG